ncbi:MAG: FlgD immunoglobulin-like domain containing protein [Candidatus Eiseniibacteriota bacterium]
MLRARPRHPWLRLPPRSALLALALVPGNPAQFPDAVRPPGRHDPLPGIVRRMDHYFQKHEVDGVTMDWRYEINPTEEIRQTVVCQVLGYAELYRLHPKPRLRKEIIEHADYLLARLDDVRSHGPFDGMLAYCFWAAYEATGEQRYFDAARLVTDEMLAIPTSQCLLNGGLMVAMGTAADAKLTGNAASATKTRDIVTQLFPYQNDDGSFPHWCPGSSDIHYTGWMGMELIHIGRMTDDARIEPLLRSMTTFLEGRIGPDGRSIYEGPCDWEPRCIRYYYSRASGCGYDYDTRGWTVEPAYTVLVFDHAGSLLYPRVMDFLLSIENRGTFADMYDYWPPPDDPQYPWSIADTSAVNMSVMFWAFTTALVDRKLRGENVALESGDEEAGDPVTAVDPEDRSGKHGRGLELAVAPNPARGPCRMSFVLSTSASTSLTVLDARGRKVRRIDLGRVDAGPGSIGWDGCDDKGTPVPGGVYFAALHAGPEAQVIRFVWLR